MAAQGANDEPNKAYGDLYSKLSRDYVNDPAFSVFRDLLRKEILDIWPFAAGDVILGEVQPGRRLHSVASAARETGIGAPLLESLLIEAGAIAKDDSRPFRRKTFLADRYASLLAEIPTWVGPSRMRAELGGTHAEFEALTEEALLSPRTKIPKVKESWALQDATAFLFELQALTNLINADAGLWETLLRAKVRSGLSLREIFLAVREGRIELGRLGPAFHDLVVRKSEIDQLRMSLWPEPTERLVPAAAFARLIGLRGPDGLISFLADGLTPALRKKHERNGLSWFYLREEDIAAFKARFATLSMLAEETGEHRNTILARLKQSGLLPFAPNGVDYGAIYLREEIRRAFKG